MLVSCRLTRGNKSRGANEKVLTNLESFELLKIVLKVNIKLRGTLNFPLLGTLQSLPLVVDLKNIFQSSD